MALRDFAGIVHDATDTPIANTAGSIELLTTFATADVTYPAGYAIPILTDSTGAFTTALPVPDDPGYAARWRLRIARLSLSFAANSDVTPLDLSEVVVVNAPAAQPNALSVLIQQHAAIEASDGVSGHVDYGSAGFIAAVQLWSGGAGANVIAKTAGETLGGHRVVWINDDDKVYYASAANATAERVAGLTTGAANAGTGATIQPLGEMIEGSWNWIPGPVYLGLNGVLTQTPPLTGALIEVGVATTPTRLIIRIGEPVYI